MKRLLPISMAAIMSALCLATPAVVYADSTENTDDIVFSGMPLTDFDDGYYLMGAAVGFHTFDDYVANRDKAYNKIKGSDSSGELYLSDYDYIYIPTVKKGSFDSITDIRIEPRYCLITFDDSTFVSYYYSDDNKSSSHNYTNFAVPNGKKETVNGVDYYLYDHPYEGGYYCNDHGKYFYFSSSINPKDSDGQPLTKVYLDNHLSETDGKLYYINDNGEKESGWKNIGNHKYYFRSSDKAAICGKTAKIGGIVYRFNANGVCKGKYTGYAKVNGKKVYYKDGVAAK